VCVCVCVCVCVFVCVSRVSGECVRSGFQVLGFGFGVKLVGYIEDYCFAFSV